MSVIQKIDYNDKKLYNDKYFNSSYYYWCDIVELKKMISLDEDLKYLPCYPYEPLNHIDLINKNLLIFFKNPRIFYGILKIQSILVKVHSPDINVEKSKKLIKDEYTYINLIQKYNMVDVPNIFFIKFNYIDVFEYEIDIKSFNKYLNMNNIVKSNELDFIFPKKIKSKHIVKSYYKHFQTYLFDYINFLKNKQINKIIENDSKLKISNLDKIIDFKIPILWNGCEKILLKIKKQNINKKLLSEHWNNCKKCEIINNNNENLDINENKITIKNIELQNNFIIMEKIISDYKNIKNFSHSKINSDFKFDDKKINMIYCFESNNIYKNCFFVLDIKK